MNIREKFKAIRKQRRLSLKTLGKVAGSATSISDFENGKTNLSNDVLLQLLGFMIVEINELFEWEDFHEKELIEAIKQIELAIKSKHIPALSQLQQDFQSLSKTKGQYIYHIISLILTITIAEYQDKKIDPHIMSELTDYFFSLEYWTNLDVGLLGNIVHYMTTDALILLTNDILEHTPQILRNNLDRIRIDTVLNCLTVLINRKEEKASRALLKLLFNKHYPNYFAFEKLYLHELQAVYDFNWKDKEQALAAHHVILATISLLFTADEAKEWDSFFQESTSSL
ncbi:DNA-binding protein [Streptococcus equi subsp. zooepidemicus Sz105]|uniref:helix-turn-helix domain-containing protein n=1 Tax=Streptococcus equi TaxID=1336 RepID=UPI0005B953F9|nr:Rgg/GadR/MutR family transcriptional regulator [Streptococcus equi]KIS12348.1 DNA-binding protein [Streptococcus equi subsp. zooepidemicus Sz105]MDI5988553.1 helix-turn-helix domain-containing protein [Streptococcus equi subsp. zooepidemicus]HEL0559319.1 helix-turn-helix domain-containing protein [Streptococcus equi subsp. zooepidemicus]HEL0585788.1 helix-turn-helix domain-containing protein [Streptococcus equi subsp. zooepidemicus]HEL0608839.1 helix-turn-helix domain-containing protein [St